jgi:hypothetical protein
MNQELKQDLELLESLVAKITIKKKSGNNNRRGFPIHRAITFGITRGRFNGKTELSYYSKKYPHIYEEIMKIGNKYCPIKFNSIHLNNNVVCPPHKDSKNVGNSCLLSFGDYSGCNIVIDGIECDAKYNPIVFNGAELEHYNTNDLIGNKYSLVFYLTHL